MVGVGLIFLSCVLFIHLGLGKAICDTFEIDFVLFRCVKCLSFWTILAYTLLFTQYRWESCLALSFLLSYAALWADLALMKIAKVYEGFYEEDELASKKAEHHRRRSRGDDHERGQKEDK